MSKGRKAPKPTPKVPEAEPIKVEIVFAPQANWCDYTFSDPELGAFGGGGEAFTLEDAFAMALKAWEEEDNMDWGMTDCAEWGTDK